MPSSAARSRWGARLVVLAVGFAPAACKGDSWPTLKTELSQRMRVVDGALASSSKLRECAPGADEGHLPMQDVQVLAMVAADDEYVGKNRAGLAPACVATVEANDVQGVLNHFNDPSFRAEYAKKILAAKGYAVVVTESATAPGDTGAGRASGHIVLFSGQGAPECRIAWEAHNSERTTVLTDAMSAKLGLHPTSAAVTAAWVSDLHTNACRVQLQALPKARSTTSHPHG